MWEDKNCLDTVGPMVTEVLSQNQSMHKHSGEVRDWAKQKPVVREQMQELKHQD